MVSSADEAELISLSALTLNPGFSIKKSEETLRSLTKENFNLKLKIFLMESKKGSVQELPVTEREQEFFDMFVENVAMKNELEEKQDLMKSALDAINQLESQKFICERKCDELLMEKMQAFKALKLKARKVRKKKLPIKYSPTFDAKFGEDLKKLQAENGELLVMVNDLKVEVSDKSRLIQKFSDVKRLLKDKLDKNESLLTKSELKVFKLRDALKNQNRVDDTAIVDKLEEENELMKEIVAELTTKCRKLESGEKDLERLLNEQSGLMKALNKTIQAKNEELEALKNRDGAVQLSSSSSEVYIPEDIDLREPRVRKTSSSSSCPLYNPLFGKEFESLYR